MLGTRYGVALILAFFVVAIVATMRMAHGTEDRPISNPVASATVVGPSPTLPDDGIAAEEAPSEPSPSAAGAAVDKVAIGFAEAWVRHVGVTADQWRNALTRYATAELMRRLADTDPAVVPADRVTGPVELHPRDSSLVDAAISVDPGTLRLRLVLHNGRWLVDGVDWDRP
jgi:hypothetical protein